MSDVPYISGFLFRFAVFFNLMLPALAKAQSQLVIYTTGSTSIFTCTAISVRNRAPNVDVCFIPLISIFVHTAAYD